ncbi:MAG: PQQ-dependent sugar dehydrogenase [Melioribacteraceae bacterium]|nr:PQQ-dependent sugar dehydrogenase [Melioribacteraceae bacterium]
MKKIISASMVFMLIQFTQNLAQISIISAFPNLTFQQPVDIQNAADGSGRLFVLEQEGIISVFQNDKNTTMKKTFLDIRDKVLSGGEQGLLGLAFDPGYKNNGYFYVDYTTSNPRRTVIARYRVSGYADIADSESEQIILEVEQPYTNHNGGQIAFGPDGYLYISLGDGGSGGDPQNHAQNLASLLGKMLRIDVRNYDSGKKYSIPDDNPLKGNSKNYREEIYAWGLRNVWRFSFDGERKLWAADVGQNALEEINIIESGKNYGWRIMEGLTCYNPSSGCDMTGLTLPVWQYGHNSEGGYSITGGYVYAGSDAPELKGKYIYGDFVSGKIWALELTGQTPVNTLLFSTDYSISTFGVDENGELFFAHYSGRIYKFESNTTGSVNDELKLDYKLHQNYPNPFNPSTTISFEVPKHDGDIVALDVYDILGNKISSLIDYEKLTGSNYISFDGSGLTSGVYYYSMSSGNFRDTRMMVLIK